MAITVNGKKVAGVGPAGLSPYQVAVAGGYTGTEAEFNQMLAQLQQLFTSVSDGKSAVAAAITDKGVQTAADATFQQMADNVRAISVGGIGNLIIGEIENEKATNELVISGLSKEPEAIFAFPIESVNSYTLNHTSLVGAQYISGDLGVFYLDINSAYSVRKSTNASYEYSNGTATIYLGTPSMKAKSRYKYIVV